LLYFVRSVFPIVCLLVCLALVLFYRSVCIWFALFVLSFVCRLSFCVFLYCLFCITLSLCLPCVCISRGISALLYFVRSVFPIVCLLVCLALVLFYRSVCIWFALFVLSFVISRYVCVAFGINVCLYVLYVNASLCFLSLFCL